MLRKFVIAASCTLMLSIGVATPAGADAPVQFDDSDTFTDINPCTGLEHQVTLNFSVSIHEHGRTLVVHSARSGSTSDGFTMIGGNDQWVENAGGFRGHFMDQWRGPDGAKFRVRGQIAFNESQGEVKVEHFSLACIGN